MWTTTRVVALNLALGPCHDATIPWALVGRALGPLMALVDSPGPLWAGSCGPTGPLWAPLGPSGPGPCGLPWALVGRALVGSLGPQ